MAVSYKRLWHILLDKNMLKKDLEALAEITHYQMTKLSKDENVTTEVIGKICKALNCTPDDIMEFIIDEKREPKRERSLPAKTDLWSGKRRTAATRIRSTLSSTLSLRGCSRKSVCSTLSKTSFVSQTRD